MQQDRPYQAKAHVSIREGIATNITHQLIQAATGTGKTVIFSQLPEQLKATHPGKMLVLAHREELIDQAIAKMLQVNPTLRIDKEMAEHHADPSQADVIVASVATLGRKGNKRIEAYDWTQFDKFVVDEAHHAIASTYMNIYEAAGLLEPGDKRLLLGVTATPARGDGQALAKLFQKIVFSYPMRQAIEEGWLVDVRGVRISTTTSLDGIKVSQGEYDKTQLANTVNTPERNQLIVSAWLKQGEGRQTLGFTAGIQHAKDLAAMFVHYGVKAEAVWGDDPERAEKIARHKSGETTVLLNSDTLVEGYDDWQISCALLAGPTKSPVKFTQMVGRATRLQEFIGNLLEAKQSFNHLSPGYPPNTYPFKIDCLILDVVDASSRNSLVTLPTLMGMSAKLDLKGQSLVGAVKALEEAQKQYPHIDFNALEDITQLQQHIENVNLFEVKFPPEVEGNSTLSWYPSPTGGYILILPAWETGKLTPYGKPEKVEERIEIKQNLLDKWELFGTIKGKRYRGERSTIEEVFSAADNLVSSTCTEALKVLRREETWHKEPATAPQLKLLRKFFKGKAIPPDIDKGTASKLIASHYAGKNV